MGDTPQESRRKRLEFVPSTPFLSAFNKFCEGEDHESEAVGLKALVREGLQRRGLMPGPKDLIQQKP